MTTRITTFAALFAALLGCTTVAQSRLAGGQDPMALLQLQQVVRAALDEVGPAVVTVETFGGVRQARATEGPGDVIAAPEKPKPEEGEEGEPEKPKAPTFRYETEDLGALFEKIDPDELAEAWKAAGLEPKADDAPFEAKDLAKLPPDMLRKLMQKYEVGPFSPEAKERRDMRRRLAMLGRQGFQAAQGATTGTILSPDGWIVVSRFALSFDPTTILVTLPDGRTFPAERFGEDTSRGIALLKIDATDLPVPTFVDPTSVAVGQWAFALGRTFAKDGPPAVHMGIVSATDRLFGRAIQVDANTSPSNYGGPIVDLEGRVLGIAAPLSPSGRDAGVDWYDSGIGFATTLFGKDELIARMQAGETLHRGWLGVALKGDHLGPGAVLQAVAPDSPASEAGLDGGHTVLAVDGVPVKNPFHFQVLLSAHMAGDTVTLRHRAADDAEPVDSEITLASVPLREREAQTRKEETFTPPWEGEMPPKDGDR